MLCDHSVMILQCDELAASELKLRLERFGAHVTVVTTLRETIELTESRRIDVAFIGYASSRDELKAALEDGGVSYVLCGTPVVAGTRDRDLARIIRLSAVWRKPRATDYLH